MPYKLMYNYFVILGHSRGVLFVVNTFFRKLLQTKYLQLLFLTMTAILDAILDFSARTNFRQCIPLVSQPTDYKVHFGICHVLLYFHEHPTFILALKVTLLLVMAAILEIRPDPILQF